MNNITDNAAMITKFQAQSNTFDTQAKFSLHKPKNAPTICRVTFNQATSCGKLNQVGKQAAPFAIRANAAIFMLALPLRCLFSMVNKGKARLVAAATTWQFSTLALCLPPLNCGKLAAVWKNQVEKAHSMQTQSTQNPPIQQANPSKSKRKSGFFSSIWRKGFPSIDAIVKQVSNRVFQYQFKREHIRAKFRQEWQAWSATIGHTAARCLAIVFAQCRADAANGIYAPESIIAARVAEAKGVTA